jgi:hypothetical protein
VRVEGLGKFEKISDSPLIVSMSIVLQFILLDTRTFV